MAAGDTIAESEVPPAVWQVWVEQGIVVIPEVTISTRRQRAAARRGSKKALP